MQKFGIDSLKDEKLNALELEMAKEKSSALGIAGKELRRSIELYRQSISADAAAAGGRERLLDAVTTNIQALIVQRELVGFVHENMRWVIQTYDPPKEALLKLGISG